MFCVFRRNDPPHPDHGKFIFSVDKRFSGSDKFRCTPNLHAALAFQFGWLPGRGWECSTYFHHIMDMEWHDLLHDNNFEAVPVNLTLV